MKTKQLVIGIITTLLVSAGLIRAADHLNPIAPQGLSAKPLAAPSPNCQAPCGFSKTIV